jgi:hypothetical protein
MLRAVTSGARRRWPLALGAALVAALACGRVVAPAPPSAASDTTLEGRAAGDPRLIAPRAARRLQDMGFTTRRFATDSLWGWRAQEQIAARLRYATAAGDSTRVLVELWGPCPENRRGCLRREAMAIIGSLQEGETAPQ